MIRVSFSSFSNKISKRTRVSVINPFNHEWLIKLNYSKCFITFLVIYLDLNHSTSRLESIKLGKSLDYSWKRDVASAEWNKQDIYEWERGELFVPDQPTFQRYKIKVQAVNEKGESNVAVKEVEGYSGEDRE